MSGQPIPRFFDDLVRCETRLYNALNDRLREQHGILTPQFEFLHFLKTHPRSRAVDLATNFAIGVGATSKALDRLEARGWVQRLENPADRRSSLLELTAAGAHVVEGAERASEQLLRELIEPLAEGGDFAAATALVSDLRRALEGAGVGLPTG